MVGCSIVGLWALLALGHRLTPPPNLAGQWQLVPDAGTASSLGSSMHVEQSGKFFQVSFDQSPPLSLRLADAHSPTHLVLDGRSWHLVFDGLQIPEATRLAVTTPEAGQSGTWTIHRIEKAATGNEPAARGGH